MTTKINYINPVNKSEDLSSSISKGRSFKYEEHPISHTYKLHTGIDYITKTQSSPNGNVPVYAAADGVVVKIGY